MRSAPYISRANEAYRRVRTIIASPGSGTRLSAIFNFPNYNGIIVAARDENRFFAVPGKCGGENQAVMRLEGRDGFVMFVEFLTILAVADALLPRLLPA